MKGLLLYLIQVIVASCILYAYYHFILRNKKFHQYNRYYLLAAVMISILIPFLNIPVYFTNEQTHSSFILQTLHVISASNSAEAITSPLIITPKKNSLFTLENILYAGYLIIGLVAFIRIVISLRKIRLIAINNPSEKLGNIHFVNTDEPGTPFSFFRWLFWNRKIELNSEKGEQVFRHEIFHIEQKHSYDILLMELLTIVVWINPFYHLMKKELNAIHEFLADEFAIHETEKWQYAELLLMQAMNTQIPLTNPFFHNQIKRRIAMITSSSKPKYQYLRKLLVLPIAAMVVVLFAFKYKNKSADDIVKAEKIITVVIDPGHGGSDPGVKSFDNKFSEAQLALEISKTIQRLSAEYNINVIMTRENEDFPGNAKNKDEGLKQRLTLANKIKPDAFVAIHISSTGKGIQDKSSGIEAYITNSVNLNDEKLLASTMLQELAEVYKTNQTIKQRTKQGIYVLDHNNYPSVLIECGYMDNPNDIAFISDKPGQEKIARAILKGLVKFVNNSESKINNSITSDTTKLPEKIYEKVEVEASFPGGEQAWRRYLEKSLQGFDPAKNGAPKAVYTVYIQFIVDQEGNISDVKPLTKHGYGMEEEAVKIIKKGPKWIPAIQNGKNVNAYRKQRIDFAVSADGKSTSNQPVRISEVTLKDTAKHLNFPVVIDDVFMPNLQSLDALNKIDPNNIISISLLSGEQALNKYGDKGKDGVMEIITKQNKNTKINEVTLTDKSTLNEISVKGYAVKTNKKSPLTDKSALNEITVEGYPVKTNKISPVADKPTLNEITVQGYPLNREIESEDNKVFEKVETQPSFPGGEEAWRRYLAKHLSDFNPVDNGAPEGIYTVIVQFIVHKDGFISDIKTLTHFGYEMENKVIDLIKKGPKWDPAIQNGNKVTAYVKQPVTFQVASEKSLFPKENNGSSAKIETHFPNSINNSGNIYPNPTSGLVNVPLSSQIKGSAAITVLDLSGKIVLSSTTDVNKGPNMIYVDTKTLKPGTYIININIPDKSSRSYKMIKE